MDVIIDENTVRGDTRNIRSPTNNAAAGKNGIDLPVNKRSSMSTSTITSKIFSPTTLKSDNKPAVTTNISSPSLASPSARGRKSEYQIGGAGLLDDLTPLNAHHPIDIALKATAYQYDPLLEDGEDAVTQRLDFDHDSPVADVKMSVAPTVTLSLPKIPTVTLTLPKITPAATAAKSTVAATTVAAASKKKAAAAAPAAAASSVRSTATTSHKSTIQSSPTAKANTRSAQAALLSSPTSSPLVLGNSSSTAAASSASSTRNRRSSGQKRRANGETALPSFASSTTVLPVNGATATTVPLPDDAQLREISSFAHKLKKQKQNDGGVSSSEDVSTEVHRALHIVSNITNSKLTSAIETAQLGVQEWSEKRLVIKAKRNDARLQVEKVKEECKERKERREEMKERQMKDMQM